MRYKSMTYALSLGLMALTFQAQAADSASPLQVVPMPSALSLTVHKTPTCACCSKWQRHLDHYQIQTQVELHQDLQPLKRHLGISPQHSSCHTAVSTQGLIFEGHIPGQYIRRFLDQVPADALGLSVAGMPAGSPGMEWGNKFTGFDIVLLLKDGSSRVYARVNQPDWRAERD